MNGRLKELGRWVAYIDKAIVHEANKDSAELLEIKGELVKLMHTVENTVYELDELERINERW